MYLLLSQNSTTLSILIGLEVEVILEGSLKETDQLHFSHQMRVKLGSPIDQSRSTCIPFRKYALGHNFDKSFQQSILEKRQSPRLYYIGWLQIRTLQNQP